MTAPLRNLAMSAAREAIDVETRRQVVELLAQCRGLTLTMGMLIVQWATVRDAIERRRYVTAFHADRARYVAAIEEERRIAPFMAQIEEIRVPRKAVHDFFDTLVAMDPNAPEIDRDTATSFAERARLEVYPALRDIILVLEAWIRDSEGRDRADMRERADLVDRILRDMGRIGRMIASISINASVEAARAGGDSGRAFKVIAEEVRDLARKSETLLGEMKDRLSDIGDRT